MYDTAILERQCGIKPLIHVMFYTMYVYEEKKEYDNTLIKGEGKRKEKRSQR